MSPGGRAMQQFTDREQAGQLLGENLAAQAWTRPAVFGLVRGGVPIAKKVAQALRAPLDILVVRKIGAPQQPELGVGAVTEDGSYFYEDSALSALGLSAADLAETRQREYERARQLARLRPAQPVDVDARDVIVVDDGLATGVSALTSVRSLRAKTPKRVVFATPVGSQQAVQSLRHAVDDVYCLLIPTAFRAVGQWYADFDQISDDDVRELLAATSV